MLWAGVSEGMGRIGGAADAQDQPQSEAGQEHSGYRDFP